MRCATGKGVTQETEFGLLCGNHQRNVMLNIQHSSTQPKPVPTSQRTLELFSRNGTTSLLQFFRVLTDIFTSFLHELPIHERTSLSRLSLSTSTCSSLSSFPSTSCTPSCTLSSTTRSSWKACATPPTRGVTTPTTSPPPSQVMSPTTWPSASSTTLQVPSPTLLRHRTRTSMT